MMQYILNEQRTVAVLPSRLGAFISDVRRKGRREARNAKHLRANSADLRTKGGVKVEKSQNHVDVMYTISSCSAATEGKSMRSMDKN